MRKIKKGDTVEVIQGDDRGMRGQVIRVLPGRKPIRRLGSKGINRPEYDPNRTRVVVQGVNLIKKHQRRTGDVRTQVGIIEREAPLDISNVALVCPKCNAATRVGIHVDAEGTKHRLCKKCGELID